ncbi:ATP-binding cassette domain-containing protein [Pseudomaricurvus alcaniphilus]|uniref:ABC transporter ATP-binding protein n=1 Tax=Pseudomaricurvus alcaniphilus TaxID=1166482 RepID=UPI001408BD31|nr:ATP-binding cassette domain-containing protein [Pseudomaricurvus alcaniphilus]NHN38416.1 ATP-binding cassette domain-containing protein [Pseudomaricurvus alcaniphilus]
MLEVNQLTRQYDSYTAVNNVSFTIDKGEIVGLLGHNGAGKTTIMKMLCGYLEPNRGTVQVAGLNLAQEPLRVQRLLGYLPENLPVYPEMSVADYLDYAADLKGLTGATKQAEIKRVIVATDLAAKLLAPISTLSRGYKQRVGVAQAILGAPKLLILDEPTNGLDPEQTRHMRQLIREIAKDATVILSTHIMQEVDALCSRVLILRAGQLVVDARLEEVRRTNHLRLETAMPPAKAGDLHSIAGIARVSSLNDASNAATSVSTNTSTNTSTNPPTGHSYRIELAAEAQQREVCAALAEHLVKAGYALYLLQPEYRDLETLFREVVEDGDAEESDAEEGLNHAA